MGRYACLAKAVMGPDRGSDMKPLGKYIFSGMIAVAPLWITWLVIEFVFRQLLKIGEPIMSYTRQLVSRVSPEVSAHIEWPIVDNALAMFLTIVLVLVIGWAVTHIVGRLLLELMEEGLDRMPLVKSGYGRVRKVLAALRMEPAGQEGQRVVLINFPSAEMKTVGLITRMMREEGTGRMLAVVYVPTTPDPTSGYLAIVPAENLVTTDWTMDEAVNFVITAGAVAPMRAVNYSPPKKLDGRAAECPGGIGSPHMNGSHADAP
jgi:uncharacterized membrane protein